MATLPPLERGLMILEQAAAYPDGITWKQVCECLDGVSSTTVSRLLKVLCEQNYLELANRRYKTGSRVQSLMPNFDVAEPLRRFAPALAKELAEAFSESVVLAVFNGTCFEFVGVEIVEGSTGYGGIGTIIPVLMGHTLTMVAHAQRDPQEIRPAFDSGTLDFGLQANPPTWHEYAESIVRGIKTGLFCEYAWRRTLFHRVSRPIFSADKKLIGAFLCGYSTKQQLEQHLDDILSTTAIVLKRIGEGTTVFQEGLGIFRKNLKQWEAELSVTSKRKGLEVR